MRRRQPSFSSVETSRCVALRSSSALRAISAIDIWRCWPLNASNTRKAFSVEPTNSDERACGLAGGLADGGFSALDFVATMFLKMPPDRAAKLSMAPALGHGTPQAFSATCQRFGRQATRHLATQPRLQPGGRGHQGGEQQRRIDTDQVQHRLHLARVGFGKNQLQQRYQAPE